MLFNGNETDFMDCCIHCIYDMGNDIVWPSKFLSMVVFYGAAFELRINEIFCMIYTTFNLIIQRPNHEPTALRQ